MGCEVPNETKPEAKKTDESPFYLTSNAAEGSALRNNIRQFGASAACTATSGLLLWFNAGHPWNMIAQGIAIVGYALGWRMYLNAVKTLLYRRNKLTSGVFLTVALAVIMVMQSYWYASWVITVVWFGEMLHSWVGNHARSTVQQLMQLLPRDARLLSGGEHRMVPIEMLAVNDVVVVNPGERLPVDGKVVRGATTIDQSMLTGEAVPVDRGFDDEVYAGTFNILGSVHVQMTRPVEENLVAQIVQLTDQAQREKIPMQTLADRFMAYFLPFVVVVGLGAWLLTGSPSKAATILLVATPCAFAASTPTAVFAAVSNAARRGIVIKGGVCIEALSRANVVFVDKTGTLTASTPQVAVVEPFGVTEEQLLQVAATAERPSAHPLARAVLAEAEVRNVSVPSPDEFEVALGHGVIAVHQGQSLRVGNEKFFLQQRFSLPEGVSERARTLEEKGYTTVLVARDGAILGLIGFLAMPRKSARAVIEGLSRLGIKRLVMLTGDNSRTAAAVARQLNIDYQAEASPEAKLRMVQQWKERGQVVVMVGDGINDATALAAADVGIAMGGAGTEIAASAADIVIHTDHLSKVLSAAKISRLCMHLIKFNIFSSIAFNVIGLILAAVGIISPSSVASFHLLGWVSVVISAVLLLKYHPKEPAEADPGPGGKASERAA